MALIDPNWLIAAGTIIPLLTGSIGWLVAGRRHARLEAKRSSDAALEAARMEGIKDGESKALADQQRAATAAIHRRFDEFKQQLDTLTHDVQRMREVMIRKGLEG